MAGRSSSTTRPAIRARALAAAALCVAAAGLRSRAPGRGGARRRDGVRRVVAPAAAGPGDHRPQRQDRGDRDARRGGRTATDAHRGPDREVRRAGAHRRSRAPAALDAATLSGVGRHQRARRARHLRLHPGTARTGQPRLAHEPADLQRRCDDRCRTRDLLGCVRGGRCQRRAQGRGQARRERRRLREDVHPGHAGTDARHRGRGADLRPPGHGASRTDRRGDGGRHGRPGDRAHERGAGGDASRTTRRSMPRIARGSLPGGRRSRRRGPASTRRRWRGWRSSWSPTA